MPFVLYALMAASVAFAETEALDPTKSSSDLFTADNILLGVFLLVVGLAGDYFLVRSFLNKKN